jgi:hypothetical protein
MNENTSPLRGFDAAITTETSIEKLGMPLAQVSSAGAGNRTWTPHLVIPAPAPKHIYRHGHHKSENIVGDVPDEIGDRVELRLVHAIGS